MPVVQNQQEWIAHRVESLIATQETQVQILFNASSRVLATHSACCTPSSSFSQTFYITVIPLCVWGLVVPWLLQNTRVYSMTLSQLSGAKILHPFYSFACRTSREQCTLCILNWSGTFDFLAPENVFFSYDPCPVWLKFSLKNRQRNKLNKQTKFHFFCRETCV